MLHFSQNSSGSVTKLRLGQSVPEARRGKGKQSVSLASYGQADSAAFFILRVAVKVLLTYPAVFTVEQFLKVENR